MPPDNAIGVKPWSWETIAPRFNERSILSWTTLLVVLWLVLAPVVTVTVTSFQAEPLALVADYILIPMAIPPILLPALMSLWLWVALHSIRELSAAVLLASSNNTVISTLIWTQYHEGEVGVAYALSMILIAVSFVIAFAGRRLLSWHDHLR